MDEGALLLYPELIQQGQLPYRDFETFYGPANLWVLDAAYKLAGPNIFAERGVGLLFRLLIVGAIFGLLQRRGTLLASGSALIAGCLLLGTQLPSYAWAGGIACTLGAIWLATKRDGTWPPLFAGFLAGLAVMYRIDLLPAVVLGLVPILHAMASPARRKFYVAGACALLPLVAFAFLAGPSQLLNNLIVFPLLRSNPASRFSLNTVEPGFATLLGAHVVAGLANVVTSVVALRRNQSCDGSGRTLFGLSLFALGLTLLRLERLDVVHLLPIVFLSFALLPVSVTALVTSDGSVEPTTRSVLLGVVGTMALLFALAPRLLISVGDAFAAAVNPSMTSIILIEQEDRSYPLPSPTVAMITGKLFKNLERLAKPGERLFVGPGDLRQTNYCDTFIYHLFPKLRPASYFLEMNRASANRPGSRLAADIAGADWVVLDMSWDSRNVPDRAHTDGSDVPNTIVHSTFDLGGNMVRSFSCSIIANNRKTSAFSDLRASGSISNVAASFEGVTLS